jgi:hypothetical protein
VLNKLMGEYLVCIGFTCMHEVLYQFCGTCPEHQYIRKALLLWMGELPLIVLLKKF